MIQKAKVILQKVLPTRDQIRTLFDLLKARQHSISHRVMPTYAEHAFFVENHPYRAWFIVAVNDVHIGTVYVTEANTIGVNIDEAYMQNTLGDIISWIKSEMAPLPMISSVRDEHFSIDVPQSNELMMATLAGLGAKPTRTTFVLD